jgi:hypothetical protein
MTVVTGPRLPLTRRDVLNGAALKPLAGRAPRLLWLAWGALFFSVVLTPSANSTLVSIPHSVNQLFAQGSLIVAVVTALLIIPRVVIRPTLFLVLLSMMSVMALIVSIHSDFLLVCSYRAVRLFGFVTCLWLMRPWRGRRDLMLQPVWRTR